MPKTDQPTLVVAGDVATLTFPTDDYALEFRDISLSKHGSLYAEVTARHGSQSLHVARFDLLNQREQETFHDRCLAVNSNAADWQSRLQAALPGLRKRAASAGKPDPGAVWDQALTAHDFLLQDEADVQAHVKDLVVPGCITVVAAPRASGKSLVALYLGVALAAGGVFRGERLEQKRVLLVDRDNPPALVRKRLRWLGAHALTHLKVQTRDKAPPLTDKAAWEAFPVNSYDVVIVDSIGASTEGISEKEGWETQQYLATLKDLTRRGPALLALDNTTKAATNYRGRGEKADAVDILYESRNVTGWTPSQAEAWWEDLPDFGDHTWQQRATRRKGQAVLRIAFIPSKYRLGAEPESFILEIDTREDPWTLTDVTAEVVQAGEEAQGIDRKAKQDLFRHATAVLETAISGRSDTNPMTKTEAERSLMDQGLRRQEARNLLEAQNGHHWRLTVWVSQRGRPTIVVPLPPPEQNPDGGEKDHPQDTRTTTGDAQLRFPPGASPANGRNQPNADPHDSTASALPISADGQTSGRRKSTLDIVSNGAGESAAVFFAAAEKISSAPVEDGDDEVVI